MFVCTYAYYTILTRLQEYESYHVLTHVWCSHDLLSLADHVDADIVGMVHAHDLDASTTVCGLVSETL